VIPEDRLNYGVYVVESVFDDTFEFPAALWSTSAGIKMLTAPAAAGVIVTE
jgi:hypothetical protein